MKWNEKVLELMTKRGVSQKQLAEKTGIAESSVSRYLNGAVEPKVNILVDFAKILGVSPQYLLEDSESDKDTEDAFTSISTAIARKGKELTLEEKYKLIVMISNGGENNENYI